MNGVESLRVVHVITGLSRGGAENALYRLISAQPQPAAHHVVSLRDEGVFASRLRALGVQVTCLRMRSFAGAPLALFRLTRLLRRLRPDVVQTWMYHADLLGGLAARMAGVPVFWGIRHGSIAPGLVRRSTLAVMRINACLSRWVPASIVSCSAEAVRTHRAFGYRGAFTVIPNGLDTDRFAPQPEAAQDLRVGLGLPATARVVGHVGRSHPQKDHRNLLAAFERVLHAVPDAVLLLAGEGLRPGDAYLETLLGASPARNCVLALGPRDDVASLMSLMDVFVLSSAGGEAFPNVLAEAMACAVPCVTTDVGDAALIVGDTGWVCPPRDADALAAAIIVALAEPAAARRERGLAARCRIVENFGLARMVEAYRRLWSGPGEVMGASRCMDASTRRSNP